MILLGLEGRAEKAQLDGLVEWIAHHSDFAVAPMKSRSRLHHRLRCPRLAVVNVVASKNHSKWAEWLILENGNIEKEKMYQIVLASLGHE